MVGFNFTILFFQMEEQNERIMSQGWLFLCLMHIWGVFIGLMKSHKTLDKLANWCMQVAHLKSQFGSFLTLKPPSNFGSIWASHGRDFWHLTAVVCYYPESQPQGPKVTAVTCLGQHNRLNRASWSLHLSIQSLLHFIPSIFQIQKHVLHAIFIHFSFILIHYLSTYKKHEKV